MSSTQDQQRSDHAPGRAIDHVKNCIRECNNCRSVCLETLPHCLELGGKHARPDHIRLLLDCAEICATSAGFMLRGSSLHSRTCAVCAEICEQCARDCEGMSEDPRMKACAEACRACAESCRRMAKQRENSGDDRAGGALLGSK